MSNRSCLIGQRVDKTFDPTEPTSLLGPLFLTGMLGKFPEQFFLFTGKVYWRFNHHPAKQITNATASYLSDVDTFTSQAKLLACLCF